MSDEIRDSFIKDQADAIREKLKGGMIYGRSIDMDDPDAVLVAAYFIGQQEQLNEHIKDLDFLTGLRTMGR